MKTLLFPTQVQDVDQLVDGVDIPNFSKPGTGKTTVAIAAIEKANLSGGLITCPTVATIMWQQKLEEELGAKAQWVQKRSQPLDYKADFYVMSHAILPYHKNELIRQKLPAVIVDESHKGKSRDSRLAITLYGDQCDGKGGIYEMSEQCWPLSGTPIRRYADDLWAQIRAGQPEILASIKALSFDQFQTQFCRKELREIGGRKRLVSVDSQNEILLNKVLYPLRFGASFYDSVAENMLYDELIEVVTEWYKEKKDAGTRSSMDS